MVQVSDNSTLNDISHVSSRHYALRPEERVALTTPSMKMLGEVEASRHSQLKSDDRTVSFNDEYMLQSLQEVTIDGVSKQDEPKQ